MNERIKLLAEQAGVTGYFAAGTELATPIPLLPEMEKFAELIVRECIGIVEKNESEMHYDNGMYPVYTTVCEIKDHFGVEEK